MKCIRQDCKNEAEISSVYGILPCRACQKKEEQIKPKRKFEFANLSKSHRIQAQRDKHEKDILQPFIRNKINPDFAHAYPELAHDYYKKEELEKL